MRELFDDDRGGIIVFTQPFERCRERTYWARLGNVSKTKR
jgi:hypothetical protein